MNFLKKLSKLEKILALTTGFFLTTYGIQAISQNNLPTHLGYGYFGTPKTAFAIFLSEKVKTALTLANTPIIKKGLAASDVSYAELPDKKRKESINIWQKWYYKENML